MKIPPFAFMHAWGNRILTTVSANFDCGAMIPPHSPN
jgi:hypothetical protein